MRRVKLPTASGNNENVEVSEVKNETLTKGARGPKKPPPQRETDDAKRRRDAESQRDTTGSNRASQTLAQTPARSLKTGLYAYEVTWALETQPDRCFRKTKRRVRM